MELRDLIVTPLVIMLVYAVAYMIRPRVTDAVTRRYFFPALTLKIIGALAVGFIYQFYYNGGDTFNFHTHGSRHIWEAFTETPLTGIKLWFSNGEYQPSIYKYAIQIPFFRDPSSFAVIRVAAIFDLITFSSYCGTAVLFGVFSFVGMWMMYNTFYTKYPENHFWIAVAILFIPSVAFWGSGLLKDTLAMGALGIATCMFDQLFIKRKFSIWKLLLLVFSLLLIFSIKKFILQAYLPAVVVWIQLSNLNTIKSVALRVLLLPVFLAAIMGLSYYLVFKVGEGDSRYALDQLAGTSRITAMDIGFYTGADAGSRYSLGELDGTFVGMVRLAPAAINVTLFRPYLWEVKNPLMLISSVESLALLGLTIYIIITSRKRIFRAIRNPEVGFALLFSIVYAFAVGVSTYNFGSLARYKIPLMPFFVLALIIMLHVDRVRNNKQLDEEQSVA